MRFLFLIFVVVPVLGAEFHDHIRVRRQQYANVRSFNQAPASIKEILASQLAREPIVHLPQQPVPNLLPSKPIEPQYLTQAQLSQYNPKVQIGQAPQQPTYKQIPVRPASYSPPPSYSPSPSAQQLRYNVPQQQAQPQPQQQQQQYNPQYRTNFPQPLPQPQHQQQQASEPTYQYSKNLPPQLQQLVQFQQSLGNPIPQGHQG